MRAGVEQFAIFWLVVTDADGYRVQWKKSGAEGFSADRQAVVAGDSLVPFVVGGENFVWHVISSLIPRTEYTVQVIATRTTRPMARRRRP